MKTKRCKCVLCDKKIRFYQKKTSWYIYNAHEKCKKNKLKKGGRN